MYNLVEIAFLVWYYYYYYTLILYVGHNFYPNELIKLFHNMRPLNWPNTVQLTLSIQHPSELALLLKRDALPAIEHLNITNEEMRTARPLRQHEPIFNFANMNCVK
ncbi:unnamed protein product [Rotaria magnacalcarata]|uniref:Uncharacterized protein n=1 Tax=Rotaria magnacalcarata TaxID=392030 RepID=A0A815ZQ04_9BILA|nr:unnamed protein product [Rotaria magnacalcarata]